MQTESVVTLDLHGKTVYQARVAVDAAIRHAGGAYRIRIIHGSHMGTALSDCIRSDYVAHPKVLRIVPCGDGATELVLREL